MTSSKGLRAIGILTATFVCAYVLASSRDVMAHNADSLIPIFVSLEGWTPFYWGQDRLGMLIPALALPFRGSFENLLVQTVISDAFLIGGLIVVALRLKVRWPVFFALCVTSLTLLTTGEARFMLWSTAQSYAPALGLFGLALHTSGIKGRWRLNLWLPVILMVTATWVNLGVGLLAFFMAAALIVIAEFRPTAALFVFGTSVGIVAHRFLQSLSPMRNTWVVVPNISEGISRLTMFWSGITQYSATYWLLVGALWLGAFAVTRQRGNGSAARGLGLVFLSILGYGSVLAIVFFGRTRYFLPVLPTIAAVPLLVLLAEQRSYMSRLHQRTGPIAVGVIFLLMVTTLGFRTPSAAREQLLASLGVDQAQKLLAGRTEVVTGDYWRVWPAAFAVRLLREGGEPGKEVRPVTFRSELMDPVTRSSLGKGDVIAVLPPDDGDYLTSRLAQPPSEAVHGRDIVFLRAGE